jgi:hypothetical protein
VSALLDGRGCLTDAGLDAMEAAAAGEAPPELAGHLAGCQRCQDRLLARGRTARGAKRPRPTTRQLVLRTTFVLAVILAALAALMATLVWLRSPQQ